jgi:hypothetical protein
VQRRDLGGPLGTRLHLEKLVLRLLCVGTPQGPVLDTLPPLLSDYQWKSTLHRAIFNAIAAVPSDDPEVLRQVLPAKLTRMGFPDVEWEEIFTPPSLSREEAVALVRQLLAGA